MECAEREMFMEDMDEGGETRSEKSSLQDSDGEMENGREDGEGNGWGKSDRSCSSSVFPSSQWPQSYRCCFVVPSLFFFLLLGFPQAAFDLKSSWLSYGSKSQKPEGDFFECVRN